MNIQIKIRMLIAVAIGMGLVSAYVLLSAVTTASVRFAHCGSSSVSAEDQYCRGASELLLAGYVAMAITAVLLAAAIWLRWKGSRLDRNAKH